jgi:threonine/homoserine/homoserine lactone efflux protein
MQFLILVQIMFFSFVIGFTGAITPGPVLTAVIKESPQRGWKTGPLVVFGHSISELVLLIGLVLGLDILLVDGEVVLPPWWNNFMIVISLVGGILLVVLAGLMLRDVFVKKVSINKELSQTSSDEGKKHYKPVLDGIILSVTNPFWIVWWTTIGIGLIYVNLPPLTVSPFEFGLIGIVIFYFGHILSDLSWYSFISVMISSGKKWISDKVYHVILVCCAAFLIYLGIVFIVNGVKLL